VYRGADYFNAPGIEPNDIQKQETVTGFAARKRQTTDNVPAIRPIKTSFWRAATPRFFCECRVDAGLSAEKRCNSGMIGQSIQVELAGCVCILWFL